MSRFKFTDKDDKRLTQLVHKYGTTNDDFRMIGKEMNLKPRQCRERWLLYLAPDINRNPWTREEDEELLLMLSEIGNKWVFISERLNRTTPQIKNRFAYLKRKVEKEMLKFAEYSFKFNPFYNSIEQSECENEREEEGECMREDEGKQISNEDKYISHDDYINSPLDQEYSFDTFE